MSKAIFHLALLKHYQLINVPGTYYVTVSYTVNEDNLILDEHPRYLVPLRVITPDGLNKILELMKDEKKTIEFSKVKKYFLAGVLWEDQTMEEDLPIKGERVLASFDLVEGVLRCTHIELLPRTDLEYIDINNLITFRKVLTNLIKSEKN